MTIDPIPCSEQDIGSDHYDRVRIAIAGNILQQFCFPKY